jgi:mannose-1-phosphate guanylyltransferase
MTTAALPKDRIWPVILSGGAGTRLWPLSRTEIPKQLLPLAGPDTMIAATAARVADAARFHPPLVVTGGGHVELIREQLGADTRLIVEPDARNTAPAIALAMLAVAAEDPDGLLLVMPSDHRMAVPSAMLAAINAAVPVARAGWLVTFGIRAATPETGYGYIEAGAPIADGVRAATAFVEKPRRARAEAFVASGNHSWNSGIFLFSAAAMRAALAEHAPEVLQSAEAAMQAAAQQPGLILPAAAAFAAAPNISIDHAVFEHAAKVAVCPVDPGWSDIGSWDALHGLGVADEAGNVVSGRVESLDTNGCLLRADGVILTTIGVNNLNIIATPDAVLVTARGRSQDVRDIASRLAGDPVLVRPLVRHHPWGEEQVVEDRGSTRVRRIALNDGAVFTPPPGSRLMLVGGSAVGLVPGALTDAAGTVTGTEAAVFLVFE